MPANKLCLPLLAAVSVLAACAGHHRDHDDEPDPRLVAQGRLIFRYDTFGDGALWTDKLRLHEVIASSVSPAAALAVETVGGRDELKRVGVTCALCHSTVDDSIAPGIGKRLDGWPNRDLNPGAIIALSPALTAAQKLVYNSWGKGRYDPRFNIDGKNGPVEIPPAYGLRGIHSITYTGDGDDVTYWNRYVAVTQMGGLGHFEDPRIGVDVSNGDIDLVRPALPALRAYQLSLQAPPPPPGSFDYDAVGRGRALFVGKAHCVSCHSGPKFTDANFRLHPISQNVAEPEPNGAPSYALRTATKKYRTSPLRGAWQHPPYFHNGKAATLQQVVEIYNQRDRLGLTPAEVTDIAEYLKSL
jgi:mono/diheme cytochrome c family protein